MRAGPLRHRITIERPAYQQDPLTGEMVASWVLVAKPWARIESLSARDFIAAAASQSEITTRITIRFREGVDSTMRILHRGKIYNIHGVLADPDSGLEYLTLPCSEGVNDG